MAAWQTVLPDVYLFCDSCNVYAVAGPGGVVVIDAGTGRWLDHANALPGKVAAVLCTHYFRDHSAGAVRAGRAGIPVYVPEYEHAIFADPAQHWRERETYIIYDNLWDLYAPIEPTPGAQPFLDYDRRTIGGLEFEAIPLPGATMSQTGYAVAVGGRRLVFCGEAIHSPGKLPRIAPLQYNYNDFPGVLNAHYSSRMLRAHQPDGLLPSLGDPITDDVEEALLALESNLHDTLEAFGRGMHLQLPQPGEHELERVTEHVYRANTGAVTWFLLSRDKKRVLTIDFGYDHFRTGRAAYARPANRRPLLHSLAALKHELGIDRVDTVLVSHFHDDHVNGIPLLQRLHNTQCWAADVFADLLEHPEGHCFPCNWPKPCRIDKRFALNETVTWDQYTFHFGAMSGHTRFASLIGFEVDGKRFAHTGDQVFFHHWLPGAADPNRFLHNHVYRNGALLDGMDQCAAWLDAWKPDYILTGHTLAIAVSDRLMQSIRDGAREYVDIHRKLMPLSDDQPHLNVDSWAAWVWPYRTHLQQPGPVRVRVTVRNPFPRQARLDVRLVGPDGWRGASTTLDAPPRAEVECELEITPDGPCRRQPFAVELVAEGQPYGQVAEGLLTVGGDWF